MSTHKRNENIFDGERCDGRDKNSMNLHKKTLTSTSKVQIHYIYRTRVMNNLIYTYALEMTFEKYNIDSLPHCCRDELNNTLQNSTSRGISRQAT